jgi:LmbE family N-acetylglucosaminyl deacetylase
MGQEVYHQPTDYHPDDRALSRGVLSACLLSRVGEIKSQHEPHKVGNLFCSDTTSRINSPGSIYVDVEDTWRQKLEALKLH